ncbi:hypothetical protein I3843_10G131000 [Carya illinoinensis]|uniref:Uncharacterized protein n=1 Tax=Carya illinoinensis TaxID=32201 RepID=A0A922DZD7_CARIL|nr:hypothetical protein I3760_10G137700 [Carya illinoinensis]KAG6692867.1 hypothetical protein I3842_10G136000 [Carya illinoinensis]KAG7960577.1 hypothetical protein I3843_10G131000 [Carya illinoinensis]
MIRLSRPVRLCVFFFFLMGRLTKNIPSIDRGSSCRTWFGLTCSWISVLDSRS